MSSEAVSPAELDSEAIIIGAGFSGLRMLREFQVFGVDARVLEAGTDVGGTWYWNRYPGARTDTEAWAYCFRFDQDMLDDFDWPERYPDQPTVHRYLSFVADRLDMRKHISLSTRVTGAAFDDDTSTWEVSTDTGETLRCRWLITGSGLLSDPLPIPWPGADTFTGEILNTNRWPKEDPDFTGKRVAVVGTGASAVQLIPEIAPECGQLTVFQRTPNFVMPSRNHALRPRQRNWIRDNHAELWKNVDTQVFAFPWTTVGRMYGDGSEHTAEEINRVFDFGWEQGGFMFAFKTFDDLLVSKECNDLAAEFIRNKIRAIVDDPETAELLCPTDHPVFGKRPPLGHFYYETFNRDNVTLVGVKDNPIVEVLPDGLKLADGSTYEADIIIFALGFDAVTGALAKMNITGRGGLKITDRWREGSQALLGVAVDGFPNLFSIFGPQSPLTNIPPAIEKQAGFIGDVIRAARNSGCHEVEAEAEAVRAWADQCQVILDATILPTGQAANWFLATNVPGKPRTPLFYLGGAAAYFNEIDERVANGFPGLKMHPEPASV